MKYQKTKKRWVGSRNPRSRTGWGVEYYPAEGKALSYGWWQFLARIDGKLVLNVGTYSPTTTRHQYKVRSQLIHEGKPFFIVDIGSKSMECKSDIEYALGLNVTRINDLIGDLSNRKTASSNKYRLLTISRLVEKNNELSQAFDLENPKIPAIAKKIWATDISGTGKIEVDEKRVYNFYNGKLISHSEYARLTSKVAELL